MIEVSVRKGEIAVTGHAKSTVCGAVSCLFQAMVASIEALTEDKMEYDIKPGYSGMIYEDLSDGSKLLIDSFFIGVCGVAEAYPDAITIN